MGKILGNDYENRAISKVPQITGYFWIIKVLTTGMGETTSDYLVQHINPVIAVALGLVGLLAALVLQFSVRRYTPWVYWLTVIMVAIFGTMAADVLHIGFGIPYLVSAIFFLIALAVVFGAWYLSEKTLSIHSIYTKRRELFYWITVLTTFALGTAAGDMTATTLHLGYFSSGVLFALLIAVVAIGYSIVKFIQGQKHRYGSSSAVIAFWLAYILTRPLGASFADWAGVSQSRGGLNLGTGPVSLFLLILIVCFIIYLTISHNDISSK